MNPADLNGKCIFNDAIRGRIADLAVEGNSDQIRVRAYNRSECPLPSGKPEEIFDAAGLQAWLDQHRFKIVDPIQYNLITLPPGMVKPLEPEPPESSDLPPTPSNDPDSGN